MGLINYLIILDHAKHEHTFTFMKDLASVVTLRFLGKI